MPRVIEYSHGLFPGVNYKILPLFPLMLTAFSSIFNFTITGDNIYSSAIVINIILFIPYLIIIYKIFRLFLKEQAANFALLFLTLNINTVYMVVNAELEMLLILLIVLSLYYTIKGNRISYITAFFAMITKWDSVFIVPAVMLNDFIYKKKRIAAVLFGIFASSGMIIWFILSLIHTSEYGNPYVGEIVRRSPILFNFFSDCLFVVSGFVPWMAMDYYSNFPILNIIPAFLFLFLYTTSIVVCFIYGVIGILKTFERKKTIPIILFFSGYILVHMIYQNTKSRYVLPVLWIFILFIFFGLFETVIPFIKNKIAGMNPGMKNKIFMILFVFSAYSCAAGASAIASQHRSISIISTAVFILLLSWLLFLYRNKSGKTAVIIILILYSIVNFMIYYGSKTMDHYSLSRIEFKNISLWYKDNAVPGDRMLISETNIPKYYTGFSDDKFLLSSSLKSSDFGSMENELQKEHVTLIFIDDFYIRRLKVKDKNAIERRADLLNMIISNYSKSGHFKLLNTFNHENKTSYLLRFLY